MSLERPSRPERPSLSPMSPYGRFGPTMHIGMGVAFMAMGGFVAYSGHFGTGLELSPGKAYGLATLMVLYGLFRIYRGVTQLRRGN